MGLLVAILVLVLLVAVVLVVSAPLRAARRPESGSAERDELEAARESKYREIRDAELDYRTGKLSRQDYDAVNGALRAEALEILDRLDRLEGGESARTTDERAEDARGDP